LEINRINNINHPIYFIIAGEKSADNHGSYLMKAMLEKNPQICFVGIGGKNMINQGLNSLESIDKMAVMGFLEVIKHYYFFKKLINKIIEKIICYNPVQIILIDYPGFNLRLAKKIKQKIHIPISYYISPQIWAWKENRIEIIKKYIDQMLVIFPFEEDWYKERGVNAIFVGHPLFDSWEKSNREKLCKIFNLNSDKNIIVLYPGSRLQEIQKHLPIMVKAAIKLKTFDKNFQFILGASDEINWSQWIIPQFIKIENTNTQKALECADIAMIASGTSTIEAAVFGTPMIIIYKMSQVSWWLSKFLVKIKFAGMVNIISNKKIVPELLQNNATSDKLYKTMINLINNKSSLDKMKTDLLLVKANLQSNGASKNAAKNIIDLTS
jgi:lipid-A-disaccharide synthase